MPKPLAKPDDAHVGARLRDRRSKMKITQTALANEIGVTFQQVQKYEKGTNRISSSRLAQIANVLKVDPAFFFAGMPNQKQTGVKLPSPKYIEEFVGSTEGLALIKAFMKLSPKLRRSVVTLVGNIADKV